MSVGDPEGMTVDALVQVRDWPKTYLFGSAGENNPMFTGKDPGPKGFPRWGDGLVPPTYPPVSVFSGGKSAWVGSNAQPPAKQGF